MNIKIYGENVEVTAAMKEHVDKKMVKLNRFLDASTLIEVRLKLDEQKNSISKIDFLHKGEAVHLNNKDKDMYKSITELVNKTQTFMSNANEKLIKKKHSM